jgi:hypothetical protein
MALAERDQMVETFAWGDASIRRRNAHDLMHTHDSYWPELYTENFVL